MKYLASANLTLTSPQTLTAVATIGLLLSRVLKTKGVAIAGIVATAEAVVATVAVTAEAAVTTVVAAIAKAVVLTAEVAGGNPQTLSI